MIIKAPILGAVTVGILAIGILASSLIGWWRTESSRQPVLISSGEFAGLPNPADIRGSYSFADVEKAFGVTVAELNAAFPGSGISDGSASERKVKDLEAAQASGGAEGPGTQSPALEIGTDSVRWFVALMSGLPYVPADTTGLPAAAYDVLSKTASVPMDRLASLGSRVVQLVPQASAVTAGDGTGSSASSGSPATATSVTGKTTFRELLDAGVTRSAIESVVGMPMGPINATIRDFCSANGIEFSTVRTPLQGLVDAAQKP